MKSRTKVWLKLSAIAERGEKKKKAALKVGCTSSFEDGLQWTRKGTGYLR